MEDKKENILDLNTTVATQLKKISPLEWREQNLNEYLTCVLCGQELQFVQATDFGALVVEEQSHCLHCQVRGPKSVHSLQ